MLSPADADLARRDPKLPGLAVLFDPDRFARELGAAFGDWELESAELTYLRYKPGTNCVAAYRIRAGGAALQVYAKAHGPDAATKLEKAGVRSSREATDASARGCVLRDDLGIVASVFPHDAKLPSLARLGDRAARRSLLARVFRAWDDLPDAPILTLGYKPERRYVGRFAAPGGPDAVVKFHADTGYRSAAAGARALASQGPLRLADKIGGSKRHHVVALEWIPGEPLREVLAAPGFRPDGVTGVGAALAELHAQASPRLAERRAEGEIAKLRAVAETVAFLCPPAGARAAALAERIASRVAAGPSAGRAIHGDFYDKQVLLAGDRVAIVDLDQAALGDPRWDLGLFVAHLERDGLLGRLGRERIDQIAGALCDGYQRAADLRLDDLDSFVASGLMRLAHYPFRSHEPDWPDGTVQILARAAQLLDSA